MRACPRGDSCAGCADSNQVPPAPAPPAPRSAIAQGSSEFNITALIDAKNSGALRLLSTCAVHAAAARHLHPALPLLCSCCRRPRCHTRGPWTAWLAALVPHRPGFTSRQSERCTLRAATLQRPPPLPCISGAADKPAPRRPRPRPHRHRAVKALRAVHGRFYQDALPIGIGLIGPGLIGGTLLRQLQEQVGG